MARTRGTVAASSKPETRRAQADDRKRFLLALRELDDAWVAAFHEAGLGDIYFSRLFTELWLREDTAVAKTDAYELVQGVSNQTAMKYVKKVIERGYLEEVDNPKDGRSRLLRMSPRARAEFSGVIDRASAAFLKILGGKPGRSNRGSG